MKTFGSLILISLIVVLQSSSAQFTAGDFRHLVEIGSRVEDDKLILKEGVRVKPAESSGKRIREAVHKVIEFDLRKYPAIGKKVKFTSIQLIQQPEWRTPMSRVYPSVLSGGIDSRKIVLVLTSERGYGFHYAILVYGK